MEKILFTALDLQALGILLEPDANGHAAVVHSMVAPIHVETIPLPKTTERERPRSVLNVSSLIEDNGRDVLEVGDVLFALNGKLVHFIPHNQLLELLKMDFVSKDNISMAVMSFMSQDEYYYRRSKGTLTSKALKDNSLFGKIKKSGGWKNYLISWKLWDGNRDRFASMSLDGSCGQAYLKFAEGKFQEALEIYNAVLLREPLNHTVRLSRAMCLLRLANPLSTLKDAQRCIALKPEWPSAYVCKGAALEALNRYVEAIAAYVCGLTIDPFNKVLRRRLSLLMHSANCSCVSLDAKQLVGSVAASVMQGGGRWDLFIDTIVVYLDKDTCKQKLISAPYFGLYEAPDEVLFDITNENAYEVDYDIGNLSLQSGYQISSVNSNPIRDLRQLNVVVEEQVDCVIVGFKAGSKATSGPIHRSRKSEGGLQIAQTKDSLVTFCVRGCGVQDVNGVYIAQEKRNGLYVFENENGFLISLERGDDLSGWVIGKGGKIFFAALCDDLTDDFHYGLLQSRSWIASSKVFEPLPSFHRFRNLPNLGFFTGDRKEGDKSDIDTSYWRSVHYILAIKGYGNRANSEKAYGDAESCFGLVQDQVEALLESRGIAAFEGEGEALTVSQKKLDSASQALVDILLKVLLSHSKLCLQQDQQEEAAKFANRANLLEVPVFDESVIDSPTVIMKEPPQKSPIREGRSQVESLDMKIVNQGATDEKREHRLPTDCSSELKSAKSETYCTNANSSTASSPRSPRATKISEQFVVAQSPDPTPYLPALLRGVKVDLLMDSSLGLFKSRFLYVTSDKNRLRFSTKVQQIFHIGGKRMEIQQSSVKGIVRGSIRGLLGSSIFQLPVNTSTCYATIVTNNGSYVFRFIDTVTCDEWIEYLASWANSKK